MVNLRRERAMGRGAGRYRKEGRRPLSAAALTKFGGKPSPALALVLRGLLLTTVLCVACSGRVGHGTGSHNETTAITRSGLSCITPAALQALPQWSASGTYALGNQVSDSGQAWTCMLSQCPGYWEPGQPGTTDLWQAAPVC